MAALTVVAMLAFAGNSILGRMALGQALIGAVQVTMILAALRGGESLAPPAWRGWFSLRRRCSAASGS